MYILQIFIFTLISLVTLWDFIDQNIVIFIRIWSASFSTSVKIWTSYSRPIPSGQISTDKAKIWFVVQMSAAFGLLCTLNTTTFLLGLAAPLPIILYPLAKRLQLNKDIKVIWFIKNPYRYTFIQTGKKWNLPFLIQHFSNIQSVF